MYVIRELDEVRNPTYIANPPTHVSYQPYANAVANNGPTYALKYPNEKAAADRLTIQTKEDWARYIERPSAM
jgi:hypothetical protein